MTFYGEVFLSCDPSFNGTDCQKPCSTSGASGCTYHVSQMLGDCLPSLVSSTTLPRLSF